jgi:hypothetical protein
VRVIGPASSNPQGCVVLAGNYFFGINLPGMERDAFARRQEKETTCLMAFLRGDKFFLRSLERLIFANVKDHKI